MSSRFTLLCRLLIPPIRYLSKGGILLLMMIIIFLRKSMMIMIVSPMMTMMTEILLRQVCSDLNLTRVVRLKKSNFEKKWFFAWGYNFLAKIIYFDFLKFESLLLSDLLSFQQTFQ